MSGAMPEEAKKRFEKERMAGLLADDVGTAWAALERAHILAQPWVVPHVRSHVAMLRLAARISDGREVAGQLVRVVLAGPASLVGRIPVGNDGRARTPLNEYGDVPADLAALMKPVSGDGG